MPRGEKEELRSGGWTVEGEDNGHTGKQRDNEAEDGCANSLKGKCAGQT